MYTSSHHRSLPWATFIHSTSSVPISLRSTLISLSYIFQCLFSSELPNESSYVFQISQVPHNQPITSSDHRNNTWWWKKLWSFCLCELLHPLITSSALPHCNPRLLQIFSKFTVRMSRTGVCATARLWATNRRSLRSSDWRPHDYRFPSDYQIIIRVLLHRLQSPVWNREYEIIWTAVLWRSFTWTAWDAEFFAKLTK